MDKFAVDLEKVLDDFEYNEGREETTPAISSHVKNDLTNIIPRDFKTPASAYRRPAFEPINLSDADFGAASIPKPVIKSSGDSSSWLSGTIPLPRPIVTSTTTLTPPVTPPSPAEPIDVSDASSSTKLHENEDHHEETKNERGPPDLLGLGNSMGVGTSSGQQLPDITSTSVSIAPLAPDCTSQQSFDLIKPAAPPTIQTRPETPPTEVLLEEQLPVVKPVVFDYEENVSDSELEQYLNNLADEEVDENEGEPLLNNTDDNKQQQSSTAEEDLSTCSQVNSLSIDDALAAETVPLVKTESTDLTPEEEQECVVETCNGIEESTEPASCSLSEPSLEDSGLVEVADVKEIEPGTSTFETVIPETMCSISDTVVAGCGFHEVDEDKDSADNQVNENIENVEKAEEKVDEVVEVEEMGCEEAATAEPILTEESSDTGTADESRVARPTSLSLDSHPPTIDSADESPTPTNNSIDSGSITMGAPVHEPIRLGRYRPIWLPDSDTDSCMQCCNKFTLMRRRHHCRACGLVLCSKCCNLKAPLEYMNLAEARVCHPCFSIINMESSHLGCGEDVSNGLEGSIDDSTGQARGEGGSRQPNPNNPMEYCSTIPPLQQAASTMNQPPPSVLVPSGVLKREGRANRTDVPKQVMFSDGIRPGGDLTELDGSSQTNVRLHYKGGLHSPPGASKPALGSPSKSAPSRRPLDTNTLSFIPSNSSDLPPVVNTDQGNLIFVDPFPHVDTKTVKYAVNYDLFVSVKRVELKCCVNRLCWSICTEGLACVGQDEVAIVLECLPDEAVPPQDVFHFVNTLFLEASKGSTVSVMSFTPAFSNNMLGSKDHGGFLHIRPTFQCTEQLLLPAEPYLVAILVHRWETPWARLFPLRLVLRLGAEYRYYPCPLVSVRNRSPLYTDIGHTVMKILVDFRKYSYSLATVSGLLIHMEDRQSTILFPRNRYDQVVRALDNSNDSVLAFGANLSLKADSHLVCIQGTKDENTYNTQAINIHNRPRRVTGASFVVFNGALKTPGLTGKTSIVEDGLMVQLPADGMVELRAALRDMKDFTLNCGPNNEETVRLEWTADDTYFNVGVRSHIDGRELDGIPSIRVHNGKDYGSNKIIRWTEVFIIQNEESHKANDPLDIRRVSEAIARATCLALIHDLDTFAAQNLSPLAVRATIHPENVGYEAGAQKKRLPDVYMKRLDDELIGVLHQAAVNSQDTPAVLELVFRVMNRP